MHQHDWILWQLTQEHRRDLWLEAEQERLARQASSSSSQCGHSLYHALDLLGRQMIIWGEHLQARHAAAHTRSMIHTS